MGFWNPFAASSLVRTTVGKRPDAERLARRLVEGGLAACVHVTEAASVYRWDGATRYETEFIVEARTLPRQRSAVAQAMLEGHPYEVPLVETRPDGLVNGPYLAWMKSALR